jgi:hypothetical protein
MGFKNMGNAAGAKSGTTPQKVAQRYANGGVSPGAAKSGMPAGVEAHKTAIKAVTRGPGVAPKGIASSPSSASRQTVGGVGPAVGVAYSNGGKIRPQRG